MDERDFLVLARQLASATTQAAWPSSVSRAYYAAFHVAAHLLEALGFNLPKAERAHAYLWLRLANCSESSVQRAGHALNDLRGYGNRADYDLVRALRQPLAQTQVHEADRIIQLLDALNRQQQDKIRDGIREYERDVLKEVTWRA
jgi:uncharacterized protein (UPF0332 family)